MVIVHLSLSFTMLAVLSMDCLYCQSRQEPELRLRPPVGFAYEHHRMEPSGRCPGY
jgi:hypothetical protein